MDIINSWWFKLLCFGIKTNYYNDYNRRITGSSNHCSNCSFWIDSNKVYDKLYIKPVINLKKSAIEGNCKVNNNSYVVYNLGDEITYKDQLYYVLSDSESDKKIVILLKAENLTKEEINFYNNEYYSENGEYPYLKNENCNSNNQSRCDYNYINSGIKQIIDSWARKYSNDLVSIYGYDARVILMNCILLVFL